MRKIVKFPITCLFSWIFVVVAQNVYSQQIDLDSPLGSPTKKAQRPKSGFMANFAKRVNSWLLGNSEEPKGEETEEVEGPVIEVETEISETVALGDSDRVSDASANDLFPLPASGTSSPVQQPSTVDSRLTSSDIGNSNPHLSRSFSVSCSQVHSHPPQAYPQRTVAVPVQQFTGERDVRNSFSMGRRQPPLSVAIETPSRGEYVNQPCAYSNPGQQPVGGSYSFNQQPCYPTVGLLSPVGSPGSSTYVVLCPNGVPTELVGSPVYLLSPTCLQPGYPYAVPPTEGYGQVQPIQPLQQQYNDPRPSCPNLPPEQVSASGPQFPFAVADMVSATQQPSVPAPNGGKPTVGPVEPSIYSQAFV